MKKTIGQSSLLLYLVGCVWWVSCTQQRSFHDVDVAVIEENIRKAEEETMFEELFPGLSEYEDEQVRLVETVYHLYDLLREEEAGFREANITYLLYKEQQEAVPDPNACSLLALVEDMVARMRAVNLYGYADDMSQINTALYIEELLADYLVAFYARIINGQMEPPLKEAWSKYDSLADAYGEVFLTFAGEYEEGTLQSGMSCVTNEMRMEDYRDLAHSLLDADYMPSDKGYQRLPDAEMKDLYQDFCKGFSNAPSDIKERLTRAVHNEEKAWFEMMDARLPIYLLLKGNPKNCFANATNRMQKRHASILAGNRGNERKALAL